MPHANRWTYLLSVSAVAILLAAWGTDLWAHAAKRKHTLLWQSRFTPYLVVGSELPYDIDTTLFHSEIPATAGDTRASLVLVVNDSCAFCAEEVSEWAQLFREVKWSGEQNVTIISLGGTRLASHIQQMLRPYGPRVTVRLVKNKNAFIARTGIAATPATLVLDSHNIVTALAVRLSGRKRAVVKQAMGGS